MPTIRQEMTWDIPSDINEGKDWFRKCFGLYIEGSYDYDGQARYKRNQKFVRRNHKNLKLMRSFTIRNFTEMLADEYNCSYGYAQKVLVSIVDKDVLASYTNLLIADAIEQFTN